MSQPMERTVSAGLDVHKSSVRLAAVRRDEPVAEQTLPYDHEQIYRSLSRWPGVRCCYEAGPTGRPIYRRPYQGPCAASCHASAGDHLKAAAGSCSAVDASV